MKYALMLLTLILITVASWGQEIGHLERFFREHPVAWIEGHELTVIYDSNTVSLEVKEGRLIKLNMKITERKVFTLHLKVDKVYHTMHRYYIYSYNNEVICANEIKGTHKERREIIPLYVVDVVIHDGRIVGITESDWRGMTLQEGMKRNNNNLIYLR